jgi:putative (di)nucleoside polyphosphate hydrolase
MPKDPAKLPYRPCVGVVLMNAAGELFVGQRKDSEAPAWQMPQGGIDKGEGIEEAALRELWEETGVTADLVDLIAVTPGWVRYDLPDHLIGKVWGGKYRGQKQKWVLMRFLGRDDQVRIDTAHPEFSEWRWLAPDDVLAQIVPFKRAVYAEVLEAFRPHFG